ncbi:MAG TPA: alpha/beta fold hydrolase [Candidatus Limnocylindrales bacterium]|nr:alpha/beta fold hydrolase [Candidatus Limnocylindrales bacterium]
MGTRRLGLTAALTVGPIAAWRFAQAYKARAGYPHRHEPTDDPGSLGLAFETVRVPSAGVELPGWWIPAAVDGAGRATPGPAVLLIHGWESARDRTLPNALILHALRIHALTIDVRGHGLNGAEELPLTAGEFGEDALAGVEWLLARNDVTSVGVLGHSMGGIGALLAAAAEPRVAAAVIASAPADPYRLTRQTFRLARLPFPGPLAWPLAWLTTHVFLQPRGHTVGDVSAARAIERYQGPVLLIQGDADRVVPISHIGRLERAARKARGNDAQDGEVEVLVIPGGEHSWLYEYAAYRAAVGRFLARHLGPLTEAEGERVARAVPATRQPQREHPFSAIEPEKSGVSMLVQAIKAAGNNRMDGADAGRESRAPEPTAAAPTPKGA